MPRKPKVVQHTGTLPAIGPFSQESYAPAKPRGGATVVRKPRANSKARQWSGVKKAKALEWNRRSGPKDRRIVNLRQNHLFRRLSGDRGRRAGDKLFSGLPTQDLPTDFGQPDDSHESRPSRGGCGSGTCSF